MRNIVTLRVTFFGRPRYFVFALLFVWRASFAMLTNDGLNAGFMPGNSGGSSYDFSGSSALPQGSNGSPTSGVMGDAGN